MIVFYNPPSSAQRKPVTPLSLLALAAPLEGAFEYRVIDGNLEPDPRAALERAIRDDGARVLSVTVMPGPQLEHAVPLCREVKAAHPDLTIVWGGYFPTQHYQVCLQSGFVDFVIRGHGEISFRCLVSALQRGDDPGGIPGLAYCRQNDHQVVDQGLPPLPDPDSLPDFPYHRVEMDRYVRNTFMGRTLSHHSSYGCPFFCNFCAVVNMVNGRWLAQSAERTARVVRYLVDNWRVDAIEFLDNNFFVDQRRVAEFCERIMDLKIQWWGEARIDTLLKFSERSWRLMANSGLKMVFLGAESGSDETLARMDKGGTATTEKTVAIARKARSYGILPEFSFVLGNPPDPEVDVEQTLGFIRRLKQVNPASEIILYLYTPVPLDGELYQQAERTGFGWPQTLDEWVSSQWHEFSLRRSRKLPWMSRRIRDRVGNFERVLNAYYPTTTDPSLTGTRRFLLRTASAWRYHLGVYGMPLELRALQRLFRYQRPETSGF